LTNGGGKGEVGLHQSPLFNASKSSYIQLKSPPKKKLYKPLTINTDL